ncbi:putative flagellar protein FlaG [Thiovulum sp. ES]|nr:putative flagellar protein FlaG [Thiovulum sp. ES]
MNISNTTAQSVPTEVQQSVPTQTHAQTPFQQGAGEKAIREFQQESIAVTTEQREMREKMQNLVKSMNTSMNEKVSFHYHEEADSMYIVVTDKKSGDEIRKIPSDEALKLSSLMKEIGSILDKKG